MIRGIKAEDTFDAMVSSVKELETRLDNGTRSPNGFLSLNYGLIEDEAEWWVVLGESESDSMGANLAPRVLSWDDIERVVNKHERKTAPLASVSGFPCQCPRHAAYVFKIVNGLYELKTAAEIWALEFQSDDEVTRVGKQHTNDHMFARVAEFVS